MEIYATEAEYLLALESRSRLPEGFRAASIPLSFFPREVAKPTPYEMNLTLLLCEEKTELFGGVFTRNSFPGAPVILTKRLMEKETVRGVLVNNKIANVCAPGGLQAAEALVSRLAREVGDPDDCFIPASTGVIGWALPQKEMEDAVPTLVKQAGSGPRAASILDAARGIMTTDAFPKVRSASPGKGSIVGIAKGAGMIEPNMATMLVFILTDIFIPRDVLRQQIKDAALNAFNSISIDGDQSTSDMVICISSGKCSGVDPADFKDTLHQVCAKLAEDIVRNGEGTGHVIRVTVEGAADIRQAKLVGKAVINSPLVKTAVFGNDPNVGRILMAVGDCTGREGISLPTEKVKISIGGQVVFQKGQFSLDQKKEEHVAKYLKECSLVPEGKRFPEHERNVEILIDLAMGKEQTVVLGSDLSYEYIRENADYRT